MSRGNYYYARGWVGNSRGSWTGGETARFNDFEEGLVTSVLFVALGAIIQAFSAFADMSWLSSTLPLFSLLTGVIGAISTFSIPEKGILYVGGWTFISALLFGYSLITTEEFLIDLIPVALLVVSVLVKAGVFDGFGTGGYSGGHFA